MWRKNMKIRIDNKRTGISITLQSNAAEPKGTLKTRE
jgi:hypothetical protein